MIERFENVRFIIFDLDGTLIDGYQGITDSLNHALTRMGHPVVPAEKVRYLVGNGLETLFARIIPLAEVPRAVQLFRSHYKDVCLTGSVLFPGVADVLRTHHHAGLRLPLPSNKPGDFARQICSHLGLDPVLDLVLGAFDVEELKPHPLMLTTAMNRLGASPQNTLYVGDMHVDVQTARAAGLPVVCVLTGSSTREQLTEARPDAILDRLDQLLPLLGLH